MREVLDFDSLPPATLAFDDLRKELMSLVPLDADITPEGFAKTVLGDRAMFMSGEREQLAARSGKLSNVQRPLTTRYDSTPPTQAFTKTASSFAVTSWAKALVPLADG